MEWEAGLLLAGILFILLAVFSLGRSRKKNQQANPGITAREQIERVRQRQGVRDDLQGLMVEIEQMAKRLGAQLDAKTIHMEKTLREADERIAQLKALHETAPPNAPATAPSNEPADQPSEPAAPPQAFTPPPETPPAVPTDEPYVDPLTRDVYALADAGKGPQTIAQELREHVGKVELILALRQG